jgi:hypothetical protein
MSAGARRFPYDMTVDTVWNSGDQVIGVHRAGMSSKIREGVRAVAGA